MLFKISARPMATELKDNRTGITAYLETDFLKRFNPDRCLSLEKHFHTNTTTLIHDLTFDVFTFKGIILKQVIQGIAFIEYTSCQMTKELSYGSEYNIKRRPVYRVRFPWQTGKEHVYLNIYPSIVLIRQFYMHLINSKFYMCNLLSHFDY